MSTDREIDRIQSPEMEYYRHVYSNSCRWDGQESLENKTIIIYFEQGFGDRSNSISKIHSNFKAEKP